MAHRNPLGAMSAASDQICIHGLRAFGRHGVFPAERERGQTFIVDLTLDVDLRRAGRTDALADTLDYGGLCARIAAEVERTRFDLIEALAEHLATLVLSDARVRAVTVRVAKPQAPLDVEVDAVAVVVHRRRNRGSRP
jgi:7,8-dihydroneopterin aldolase/epimerase/oxygenase